MARTWRIAALAGLFLVLVASAQPATIKREAHQRTITLGLAGHIAFGQVTGTVNDSYRACSAEVPVTIQRFRAGEWRWVATTTTRKDGTYRVRVRAPRGTYRAVATKTALANGGTCAPRLANMCVGVRVRGGGGSQGSDRQASGGNDVLSCGG